MNDLKILTARIHEVVSRPYPVCLKALHATMEAALEGLLQTWTVLKPCQIQPLIERLLIRIESDKLARSILTKIVGLPPVFEDFLGSHPQQFDAMCSYLLADIRKSPASIDRCQPFIRDAHAEILPTFASYVALVEATVSRYNETSEQWLLRVRHIFATASLGLLSRLSEPVMQSSFDGWREQLRSSNSVNALAALAIACNLQKWARQSAASSSSSPPVIIPTFENWAKKCSSLFQGEKCRSIVRTTVLTVLKLFSEDASHDTALLIESLKNADTVLRVAPDASVESCTKTHHFAVRKLAQKIMRMSGPPEVRAVSLSILSVLDRRFEIQEWPELIKSVVQQITEGDILNNHDATLALESLLETLTNALQSLMDVNHADRERSTWVRPIRSLVGLLMESCQPGRTPCENEGMRLAAAEALLGHLSVSEHSSDSGLSHAFVRSIDGFGLPDWWSLNLESSKLPDGCGPAPVCTNDFDTRRQQLRTDISLLVVEITCKYELKITPGNTTLIRKYLSTEMGCGGPCQYPPSMRPRPQTSTESIRPLSTHSWREDIRGWFSESSDRIAAQLERFICELTSDLQARCDNVEEPLYEARQEAIWMQQALEKAQEELQRSKTSCNDVEEALQTEKESLRSVLVQMEEVQNDQSSLQQRYEECSLQLANTKEVVRANQQKYDHQIHGLREQKRQDLGDMQRIHQMRNSELEEHLAEMKGSETFLKEENDWLRAEMERNLDEAKSDYDQNLSQLKQECRNDQEALRKHLFEVEIQLASKHADNERLETDVEVRNAEVERLASANQDIQEQLEVKSRALQSKEDEVRDLEAELEQERMRVQGLQQEKASCSNQLQEQAQQIAKLERSEASWHDQCKACERALKKARKAEQSVLAILQENSGSSPVASRGSTVTALASPAPRLPEGSFVSDDDEDYSDLSKVGRHA